MSARLAISLAAAAVLLSSAALAIAVMALTRAAPGSWAPIIDAPAASAPAKDEPAEYTKSLVRDAIQRYEREGLQATIDYYNSTENVDGAWYVFVVNNYGYTIAHHNPKLRNRDPSLRIDSAGRFYGDDLVGATEKGRWVDYVFVNPETGAETQKHTWAVKRDGLIFASGWYEGMAVTRDGPASPAPAKDDAAAYTKSLVRDAIQRYEREGLQATIEYYNNPENVDGQWYVFVINTYGFTIAHHNPSLRNRDPSLRVDSTGRFYGDDLLGATEEGRWVEYHITNPDTGENALKHTWAVKHDGLIFASGWYER